MNRDNLAYLAGGLAFGFLFGFGVFRILEHRPAKQLAAAAGVVAAAPVPGPAGTMAPTQIGPGGAGAPMIEEINGLKRVLQNDPGNVRALTRLANLYHDANMFQQAIGFYEKALQVTPTDPDVLTDLGTCLQAIGENEKALDSFSRAQKADPAHWQSLFNTVVVLSFKLGRFDEAEAVLNRLDRLRPSSPDTARLRDALASERAKRAGP